MDIRGISSSSHAGSASGPSRGSASDFGDILKATEATVNEGLSSHKDSSDIGLSALQNLEKDLFSKLSPKAQASRSYGDRGIF
jgi:hypothetical protein